MNKYITIAKTLRKQLHQSPELAFEEVETKKKIYHFLKIETELDIIDGGTFLWAKWSGSEKDDKKSPDQNGSIAFRADFDAVQGADGKAGHYCGHDGHTAVLCAFAKYINDMMPGSKG